MKCVTNSKLFDRKFIYFGFNEYYKIRIIFSIIISTTHRLYVNLNFVCKIFIKKYSKYFRKE